MYADTIPTLDDLTAGWFTALLQDAGDLGADRVVTQVRLEPFGNAESMMSALHRAVLSYDGPTDAPSTLIVKLASPNERQRFIAGLFKFYEREVRFYDELLSTVDVSTPRCLLARMHPSEPFFVLVLEEITGLRQVDQLDGVEFDDSITVVRTLADLHAPFWGADLGELASTFIPMNVPPMHEIIPAQFGGDWSAIREQVAGELPDEVVALCDRFASVSSRVLDDLMGPDTLVHGDFRSDNLLFDGNQLVVLDFQLAAICNGVTDVAYFVGQSVRDDVAAAHAAELLEAYLDRLAAHGVDYGREAAMRSYDASLVFFLTIPTSLLAGVDLPTRSRQLGLTMLRRAAAEIVRTGAHLRYA
jgi:hypothetical protein